jgi:hypothetical protein
MPLVYRGRLGGLAAWLVALTGAFGETPLAEFRRKTRH